MRKCETCGKKIPDGHKQGTRFCSADCRTLRWKHRCRYCKRCFMGLENSILCSERCQTAERRAKERERWTRKCTVCGKLFVIKRSRRKAGEDVQRCSRKCGWDHVRRLHQNRGTGKIGTYKGRAYYSGDHCKVCFVQCLVCKSPTCVVRETSVRVCSSCRPFYDREQIQAYWKSRLKSVTNPLVTKQCLECGKRFTLRIHVGNRIYCSTRCAVAVTKRKRIARQKDCPRIGDVRFVEVWDRCNGKCWICGYPAFKKITKGYHPLKASLDHVFPLGQRGAHLAKNVRIAHLICNSIKSDRFGSSVNGIVPRCKELVIRLLKEMT
jgi:hypothetical protein